MAAAADDTPAFDPAMVESLFEAYDADGNGRIDAGEFSEMCAALGFAFSEEKAAEILKALDTNGDGTVSKGELAVFLASPEALASQVSGADGVALRAALLTRFVTRAGSELVARVSSDGSHEPVSTEAAKIAYKFTFGDVDPSTAPMRLQAHTMTAADAPAPPPELSSGKGFFVDWDVHEDEDAASLVDMLNNLFTSEPPPLPPGCSIAAALVSVDGDQCIRVALDMPILDLPPAMATMFGVSDVAEAVEGLHGTGTFVCSKSVDDITKGAAPIVEGLAFEWRGATSIPKHLTTVLTNMAKVVASPTFPFSAMIKPEQRVAALAYSMFFGCLEKYEIATRFDSPSELVEMVRGIIELVPMPTHQKMAVVAGMAMASSFSLSALESTLVAQLADGINTATDERRPLVLKMFRTFKGIHGVSYYAGPIHASITATGFTIPYFRDAADMFGSSD